MNLENQTALITGSSGGIGEDFAVAFAKRKVNLVLVARRVDKLAQLRTRLLEISPGITVDVIPADLAVPGSAEALAAQVTELGRSIDILINNAGVGNHGDFVTQGVAENAAQIQLNCVTLTELTGLFLPAMTKAGRGLVINVASTAAFQPTPGMAVYGATKAFVLSFTEALWQETKSTGVRVFALCPGATETEFFARTGEEFLTSGRQTSQQVVDTAMAAIDKSGPTVISGLKNAVLASAYRYTPKKILLAVSQQIMKAN
ncbi:SDR family oxidoreductase [Mycolicibacterium sp.]|uniref:SDR family NAD(P)-dependent oxidoreductase n=1 Tax=Mycolicibacterium sp. TaxID=2320850 RepID=UPI0025F4ADB4|nr:SDR family oxidoreductase [Mycolicibacterium sp.]